MNAATLEKLLRDFRRSVVLAKLIRMTLTILFVVAFLWAFSMPEKQSRQTLALLAIGGLILWATVITRSVRLTREIQAGGRLMALGMLDEAEACLGRALGRFSLSSSPKFMLFQQLAALLFQRGRHDEVTAICKELLRQPIRRIHSVWLNTSLLLADSLLLKDEVAGAYAAMRPVYDAQLSLADRMRLLPIQLRYELASNHPESAVAALAEKVRIAELLESQRAGLVHALLAEACKRMGMSPQHLFLSERARLYCDLSLLVDKYPLIDGIARESSDPKPEVVGLALQDGPPDSP